MIAGKDARMKGDDMRRATLSLALMAVSVVPVAATAQAVSTCGWIGSPANIMEPWEANTRSFANGNIRVARVDTGGEPVCCSSYLLVLSPSGESDGPSFRQCRIVSAQPGQGFFDVDIAGIAASYDPRQGLLLSVPVAEWHPGMETGAPPIRDRLDIRINQATGSVTTE